MKGQKDMKPLDSIDDHSVAHDATSVGVGGVLGLVAAAVTGSPEAAVVTAGAVTALGIGGMRLGPIRRGINRAVISVAETRR